MQQSVQAAPGRGVAPGEPPKQRLLARPPAACELYGKLAAWQQQQQQQQRRLTERADALSFFCGRMFSGGFCSSRLGREGGGAHTVNRGELKSGAGPG